MDRTGPVPGSLGAAVPGLPAAAWLALLAVGCSAPKALYLHPSAEVIRPWADRSTYTAQDSSAHRQPLDMATTVPAGTFQSVPVAANLGLMVEFSETTETVPDWGRASNDCVGTPSNWRCVSTPHLEERTGHVPNFYIDFMFRRSEAELTERPANSQLAKVAINEYTLKLTWGGLDIHRSGFAVGFFFAEGYIQPSVSANYGVYPDLKVDARLYLAFGAQLYYDFASWFYVYAPISMSFGRGFQIKAGSTTYGTEDGFPVPPISVGAGLGLGFRIPVIGRRQAKLL